MTKLIEPQILQDMPDFNKELLYSKVEKNLIPIFNALKNYQKNKKIAVIEVSTTLEYYYIEKGNTKMK